MKRYIRLRDFGTNAKKSLRPWKEYLDCCNNTLREKDFDVRTDQFGFLASKKHVSDKSNNIFCIGDSLLENVFVDDKFRISSVIQRHLDEKGYDLNVVNASFSGSTTLDLYNIFINKCIRFRPIAIILMSGMSDLTVIAQEVSLWDASIETFGDDGLTISTIVDHKEINPYVSASNIDDRLIILEMFLNICRLLRIKCFISTWGYTEKMAECFALTDKNHNNFNFVEQAGIINNQTRKFAIREAVPFCDIEIKTKHKEELFYDGLHPNDAGCNLIGSNIANMISDEFDISKGNLIFLKRQILKCTSMLNNMIEYLKLPR